MSKKLDMPLPPENYEGCTCPGRCNLHEENTMNDYPPEALDRDVKRYLELDDTVQQYLSEMNAIKARLRDLGDGHWEAPCGVNVFVSPPNRSFNLTRAVDMLNEEQRDLARADGYDAKKVKQFLPPALLEACMDPGSGDLRVSIK